MNANSFTIQNMNYDELFDLPPPPPPLLVRTYKAYCSNCNGMATSYDPMIRILPCEFCKTVTIPFIQKNIRGFLVRKKLKKLKQKESIYRWFTSRGINGVEFSQKIHSFL